MSKQTVVDQVQVLDTASLEVRFSKLEHGRRIALNPYHRTVFEPDTDIDAQMVGVNISLVAMNCAPVDDADPDVGVEKIRRIASVVRTPKALTEYRAKIALRQAEQEQRSEKARAAQALANVEAQAKFDAAVAAAVARLK